MKVIPCAAYYFMLPNFMLHVVFYLSPVMFDFSFSLLRSNACQAFSAWFYSRFFRIPSNVPYFFSARLRSLSKRLPACPFGFKFAACFGR